jgi:hypothetical protein
VQQLARHVGAHLLLALRELQRQVLYGSESLARQSSTAVQRYSGTAVQRYSGTAVHQCHLYYTQGIW